MDDLGQALRERRKLLGLSQLEVAKRNNISRITINRLENGRLPELGIRKIMMLCLSLGLELTLKEASPRPTLNDLIREQESNYA